MPAEEKPDLAGLRILVVEDWLLVADEIQWMLEQLGCQVVGPVPRLSLAMSIIKREQIDGAILDVNVADEPVFSVADELRERHVPFIFATGYDRSVFPPEYAECPRLSKPFNLRELRAMMARHLRPHSNLC
jgi:DNA-binding response OmpR family regulator